MKKSQKQAPPFKVFFSAFLTGLPFWSPRSGFGTYEFTLDRALIFVFTFLKFRHDEQNVRRDLVFDVFLDGRSG